MHFDEHDSCVFLQQQMPPHVELVLSYQIPGDPKNLIVYDLLLTSNVICRTDLLPQESGHSRATSLVLPLQVTLNTASFAPLS